MALGEAPGALSTRTEVATVVTGTDNWALDSYNDDHLYVSLSGNSSFAVWLLEKASSSFLP